MTGRPVGPGVEIQHSAETPEAQRTAQELVAALVRGGVRDVVVCPGSRSAPIAYALEAAEQRGLLRLHVRLDERVAGFHALGLAIGSGDAGPQRAAAVVTTSGTAVANLHPAVLEASHARVPLVVVSADRPHEMRGTGANQTTDQVRMFGSAVRAALDVPAGMPRLGAHVTRALAAALGTRGGVPGPVQIDVALRDPLTPAAPWDFGEARAGAARAAGRSAAADTDTDVGGPSGTALRLPVGDRTVVVAGDRAGRRAARLAAAGAWPLLAEPSSGVRDDPRAVPAYRLLLDEPSLGRRIRRVLVLGHPTLSRPVSALLARDGVEVVVVDRHAPWTDVAGTATAVVDDVEVTGEPTEDDAAWEARWRRVGAATADHLRGSLTSDDPLRLAATVWDAEEPAGLVVGSSSAVRDLDLLATPAGGPPRAVHANRGLAGIDGTLATAGGVAQASGVPVRALVGDLTFLHDAAALAVGEHERGPDLQVVVVDDHGGGIFATLEYGADSEPDAEHAARARFERLFATPQAVDLVALAAAYGARAREVSPGDLAAALREPVRGRSVLVVRAQRAGRRAASLGAARRALSLALAGEPDGS